MAIGEEIKVKNQSNRYLWISRAGIALIAMSALILFFTFYPALKEELKYVFSVKNKPVITKEELEDNSSFSEKAIIPADEDFGIVIPKISANSKIVADVDPNNSAEYQRALTEGVAHAKGSAYPGEEGNIFIFAHSGVDFYEAARYNAVFYLLNKLGPGDDIYIFYKNNKLVYKVKEVKVVGASEIKYLEGDPEKRTLTLMACWPAGTTWKRLVVIGEQL